MDAKDSRLVEFQERFRNRLIAGKHGLFHRPVSRPTLSFSNVCRMAVLAQNHLRLWQIEIEGSIGSPAAGQALRNLAQCPQLLANFGFGNDWTGVSWRYLGVRRRAYFGRGLRIAETSSTANHRAVKI